MSRLRPTMAFWAFILLSGLAWMRSSAEEPPPSRIISLSPNITEILFAMGSTNSVVGVSDYCSLPPDLDIPRCGGVVNPNLERILALHASNIFLLGQMDKVQSFAAENKLRTTSINIDSSTDLYREIQHIGNLMGVKGNAWHLVQRLNDEKRRIVKKYEHTPKYRTLVVFGHEEGNLKKMMAVGGTSFISEMLTLAHGDNVFADQKKPYFDASLESIVALQPDVIFELHAGKKLSDEQMQKFKDDWKAQDSIPAVKHGRIVVATNDFLTIPGPRMFDIAKCFAGEFQKFSQADSERKP